MNNVSQPTFATHKACSKCGETKPLESYHRQKLGLYGRIASCKECVSEHQRHRRLTEPGYAERESKRARAHQVENPHLQWRVFAVRRMERYGVPVVADLFTKADVVSRYGDACAYCGGEFQELDHFIPLKAGGTHVLSNVWPSCTPCNRTKGKLDLETVALAKVGDGCRG